MLLSPFVKKWMHLDTLRDAGGELAGQGELAEPIAPGLKPQVEERAPGDGGPTTRGS